MNARIVAGHAFVAGLFITAWEVAIAAPTGPADAVLVLAGIVGPPAVAGVSLALMAGGEDRRTAEPAPAPPVQRRAATQPQQKAVTR